jgi:MFS family permease
MAILAAGVGYAVRGGILKQWANEFGFTMTELGAISGGGLTGFGLVIIFGALLADKIGYGKLMVSAFILHVISAAVTLATPWAFATWGKGAAYECLFWGMFIFAVGNGLCEAVVNPLTATLYPKNKTHYLNILHAGWPAGLVLGSVASAFMAEKVDENGAVLAAAIDWKIQISLFIVPVVIYGAMLMGQRFPRSEAAQAGVSFGEMLSTIFAPLMILLLITHALVGYVELGTDSWIGKITGTIMGDPMKGLLLFSYTSMLMFILRFFAGPIVHRISPLGLLLVSAILGAIGLTLLGSATTVMMCIIAATVYALGKTFLWPTMLAVVSERFPKGGAVSIGMLGAAGMLSAGLVGTPAIGFKQDRHASAKLQEENKETFDRYVARDKSGQPDEKSFFTFKTVGLDGAKVGTLEDGGKELARVSKLIEEGKLKPTEEHTALVKWWEDAKKHAVTDEDKAKKKAGETVPKKDNDFVGAANLYGGQTALRLTAYVPAAMAVIYLLMILGFKARGGYKALSVSEEKAEERH